jgi:ABC-type branched-subunit amino acid transport system ATPase component
VSEGSSSAVPSLFRGEANLARDLKKRGMTILLVEQNFRGSIWIPVSSVRYATSKVKRGLSRPLPRMRM